MSGQTSHPVLSGLRLMPHPDLPPRETEAAGKPGVSPSCVVPPILDNQGRARGGHWVQATPSWPQCANPSALGGWRVAEKFPPRPSVPHLCHSSSGEGEGMFRAALPAPDQASVQPSRMALFFVSAARQLALPPPGGVTTLGLFSPLSQGEHQGLGLGMTWEFCSTQAVAAGPSRPV